MPQQGVRMNPFDGFFGAKFHILKPRGSVSLSVQSDGRDML
jgi:hypothetical protein